MSGAQSRRRARAPWQGPALAAVLAWLVGYPLLVTLADSLGLPVAPTAAHYRDFVARPDEWLALWHTLWISLASVALAAALGVPLAFLSARSDLPARRLLAGLFALPIALPPLVGVIAFLFLYGESGFLARALEAVFGLDRAPWSLTGPAGILLVHAYSMYVYFYLFVRAALARLDRSQLEAAASLGAGRLRTLARVELPLLRPALAGAALLTFMTSLASFSAPYIFGGGFRVMTTQIVASRLNGELGLAQAETIVLSSLALLALWSISRLEAGAPLTGGGHGAAPARRGTAPRTRRILLGLLAAVAALVLLLPHLTLALVSFVPPGSWTTEALPPVLGGANYKALLASPERLRPLFNSLWMAVAATAGALALGFAAARTAVARGGRLGRWLERSLALPWAIPGTVFAVALATTYSVDRPLLGRFVLVGTPVILPFAYFLRSLPLTGRSCLAGFRQLDPAYGEAAASLGAGRRRIVWRVIVPLVRPALLAGASLAFLTALGDFVTSVLLYTYETRPISIEIYSSLRLQETGVAAAYGVVLMLISAAVFTLWGREASA